MTTKNIFTIGKLYRTSYILFEDYPTTSTRMIPAKSNIMLIKLLPYGYDVIRLTVLYKTNVINISMHQRDLEYILPEPL